MARGLKFWILEVEGFSENIGADLRLCFRIHKSRFSHYAAHMRFSVKRVWQCLHGLFNSVMKYDPALKRVGATSILDMPRLSVTPSHFQI